LATVKNRQIKMMCSYSQISIGNHTDNFQLSILRRRTVGQKWRFFEAGKEIARNAVEGMDPVA
jgi:hypothetical protein